MSSPLDLIRLTLVELIEDMNGDNPDNVDSQAAATNICNMALSDLKRDELDMATSLLYSSEKGIMYFLKKSLDKTIHAGAKVTFLDFTAEFISRSPDAFTPYIVDIKRTCLSLFLNDQTARVRKASMLPIKIILSSCSTMVDPELLDVSGLFVKLFTAYATQQSKMASTVKAEVLDVLGTIARYFPNAAEDRSSSLIRWCLTTVQEQLKPNAKQELNLIAGAIAGLDNCLYSFESKATKDVPTILQLIKTLVHVPEDLNRFATPIAALYLFAHHIHLFRSHLIEIYEWMYQRIASYCEHPNIGMSRCGYYALDVFLQEMANVLTTSPTTEQEYNCFLFFTTNFTQILSTEVISSTAQYKAMSVAIRGYGYFAAPCKHIAPDQLMFLLAQLLKKSAFLVSSNTYEGIEGSVYHLSPFITAYTFVAQAYDEIPEPLMAALNQMAISAIVNFIKMTSYARAGCTIALERLLVMLFRKGEGVLRGFVDKFFYKLLVFTCSDISRPVVDPLNNSVMDDPSWHSYSTYMLMWRSLFKPTSLSLQLKMDYVPLENEELEKYSIIIYGSTMESYKRLVNLLNLSISDSEADSSIDGVMATEIGALDFDSEDNRVPELSSEISQERTTVLGSASGDIAKLQANCAKDFVIFQNLTDFWNLFLKEVRPDLFGQWAFVIGETLVELSAKNPLVSGFYKMFSNCLQVCESTNLFSSTPKPGVLEDGQVDVARAAVLFKKYIREVMARLEQYKDDLLASCLQLVLSSPIALTDSLSVIPPIQLALKLGLGFFPLASVGLDAIERWIDNSGQDQEGWFSQVLPSLNEYLMVQISASEGDSATTTMATSSKRKPFSTRSKLGSIVRSMEHLSSSEQIQSLQGLQLRVLRLLGRQAQHNKLILSRNSTQNQGKRDTSDLLAWDPETRLKFKIPFQEMKIELHLDEMLPRIVDLAENSLNRQIKVAGCELLHSLVILMVGSSAFRARDAQNPKRSPYHKIYLKVFPALLRLAVDVDQVPRSLYRPLVSQLIHWLTNSAQYENPETIALLNCCLEAACDTLGPLRDYGAECLGEFVKWSVRQTGSTSSSVNVKSLLKRVYNLASHSSPTKRLGSALIVNRIYRVFREEASLVSQFTMELLYWMLSSLRLSESDHSGLGTSQQACVAISHLQRIIQVKASIFQKDTRDRRKFPGLESATLECLVDWLFKETSRSEVGYTKMCRTLFDSFVKLLPGVNSAGVWVEVKVKQNPSYLSSIYTVVDPTAETFSQPMLYYKWCVHLAAVLSNYIWLLQHPGSSVTLLEHLKKATIFVVAGKFTEKCFLFSESLARGTQLSTPLTATERRRVMDQNFVTARKAIGFASLVVSKGLERNDNSLVETLGGAGLLGTKFFSVFASCLFNPDSIGNDELLKSDSEVLTLRIELKVALKTFHKLPGGITKFLGKVLMDTISSGDLAPLSVSPEFGGQDPVKLKAAIEGMILLRDCQMFGLMFDNSAKKSADYIYSLFGTFMTMQSTQSPLWISYCSTLLGFSLSENECSQSLWKYLLNPEKTEAAKITYLKYTDEINRHLATHFSSLSPQLASSAEAPLMLYIWNDFLGYLFSHTELSTERTSFLEMFTRDFSLLERIVSIIGNNQAQTLIVMWKRIIALSPRILRMTQSGAFVDYFFKVFQSFFERDPVKREYLTLPVMSEAFPVLPVFLSYSGARTAEFEIVFNRAILNMMPMSSQEYEQGSSRFKDYISAIDLLLKALVGSSSISLFKTLMGIAIRESNHPHMEQMQKAISSFALKLPLSKFLDTTSYCFDEFFKKTHSDEHRRNIVQQVLLPILRIVPPLNVSEFFVLHISQIMGVIKQDSPRPTDPEIRRDFVERECCYELIHVLYMRLPADLVNAKGSKIVDAFTNNKTATGKELTVEVFRTANAAKFKQDTTTLTPEAAVLRDDYKRAAYNALAAAILCTQRKEDFFRQFLFRDNEAKKEFVWENIVDLTAHYYFEQVLSGPVVRTKLSDLRSRSLHPNKTYNSKYKYMSSQYLRDSSLSQSVGIIDETDAYIDSEEDSKPQSDSGLAGSIPDGIVDKAAAGEEINASDEPEKSLELDALNSNPCMKMLLLVIGELNASITPPPTLMSKEEGSMPSWMKDIHRKLVSPHTPLNIRLFLAKIITNQPEAFEMYATSWIRPLMKLAMEGESYGEAMNYFVQDLCVIIVVWGANFKLSNSYDDRVLLLSFLSYLMKNCYHETRLYLLNNIELIKGVFENWSSVAIVPTNIIYNSFKNVKDDKKNITGIQLLGIVLTHDNPPFYNGPEIDLGTLTEEQYYDALIRNMRSTHKAVYTSAAEVCGLVLSYMKRHDSDPAAFQDMVTKTISDVLSTVSGPGSRSKNGIIPFLHCLHKVQLNFPEITDAFSSRLLFLFPQLLGEERTLVLEILAGRAAQAPDLFLSLQGLNFLGCLKHKDESTQFAALSIIYGLWESLKMEQIQYFLDTIILEFSSHSSLECRKLYYSILMVLFEKFKDTPTVGKTLRTQLLRGLGDTSESIRHTVVEFWYDNSRLPQGTFQRLAEIVKNMYDAQAEDKFLSYATYMLLDRTKKSVDYNEPIFDQSLPNAKFNDNFANIDTSWRSTTVMTPLFVNTQQSQSQDIANDITLQEDELKATQATFEFSMTLEGGTSGIRSQLGGTSANSSTLLFKTPGSLESHGVSLSQSSDASPSQKYRRLHYRNIKQNTEKQSQQFKMAYEAKLRRHLQSAVHRENARSKSVSMIRKYREGDLPDIQIPYSDIIRPLQSLAELDVEVSRVLFSKLVLSLIGQVDNHMEMTEDDAVAYKDNLMSGFKRILEVSTSLYTPFVGSILRICHDYSETDLPADLISKVAVRSSNQHLGIILIEKQIQFNSPKERSAKRQKTSVVDILDPKRKNWIELARIYKSVDEKDIFKSIYENKVATTSFTKEAIEAEVVGDYDHAVQVYFDGIAKFFEGAIEIDDTEKSIWAHGRLECLEYLGDWDVLEGNMMSDLEQDPKELWTEDYLDPYLHYFLTCYIKLVDGRREDDMLEAWTADNPNPIFEFIEKAMNNSSHRRILTSQFQSELALTAIMRSDFKQASHYVKRSFDRFLSVWSNLHPLSEKPRLHELANLQRIVEMEEFLESTDIALKSSNSDPLTPLLAKWGNRYPGKTSDSIITWNNVLDDRKLMIERLDANLAYSRKRENGIIKHHISNYIHMSEAAREQGNFFVANTCITSIKELRAPLYDVYYSQIKLELSKVNIELDHGRKTEKLLRAMTAFEECSSKASDFEPNQIVELNLLGGEVYGQIGDLLRLDSSVLGFLRADDWFLKTLESKNLVASRSNIAQDLQQRGLGCLRVSDSIEIDKETKKDLRFATAKFCDKILRHHEGDPSSTTSQKDLAIYANSVVRNTLLSMKDDELGASELFPRLLQIIELYPSSQKIFTDMVMGFPRCWTFVRWIQQMVAVLDKPIGTCVMPILSEIARQYPNALYYPLTISSENYEFEHGSLGEKRRKDVELLKRAVYSPLKEDFIFELRRLTNIEHIFKDWLEQTIVLFQNKARNAEQIMTLFQDLYQLCLDSHNPRLGSIAKAFAAKHGAKLESLCGKTGSRLATMSNKDFNNLILKYCRAEIINKDAQPKKHNDADLLKAYSPWLHSFQSTDYEESIDIPGQYTGLTPPSGQPVAIIRFDQRVLVMSSIRKPKRICILGSDEKEHLFLVKGGEDLRLDQRIQQLFSLMNDIMYKDPQCSQQNISIGTYKVIPMSGSLGILEWVDNTKPLRHCIEGEIYPKDLWRKTQEQYNKFVASFKGDMMGYHNLFMHASREKVVKHMESLYSFFRDDYLRQSISRLAASPEAFLMLRSEFAKSLAAINVCSYILGIGDRHLENFLLDMSTGCLIPIDFGHAFGSATEVLPVPELAPFRLTRQLESFLSPLGPKGLLEHPMVCIMKALQTKKDVILNTMDVFVKEPLLDWRKFAVNQAKEQKKRGIDLESFDIDEDSQAPPVWYLHQKMDIARKKLEGYNPSFLTVQELSVGHANKPFLAALTKIALGDKQHTVRARHGEICGSVQAQVECLIDMATDLDVLGRAWVGWMSWV